MDNYDATASRKTSRGGSLKSSASSLAAASTPTPVEALPHKTSIRVEAIIKNLTEIPNQSINGLALLPRPSMLRLFRSRVPVVTMQLGIMM